MNTIESIDFKSLIGQQKTMQMKMRLLALEHFKQGHSRTKIAQSLMVSRTSVIPVAFETAWVLGSDQSQRSSMLRAFTRFSPKRIFKCLGYNKWIHIFLNKGLEGLQEKPRTGRPAFLTLNQREQLRQYIQEKAMDAHGGRLIGSDIHAYILKEFEINYHPDSIYYLLKYLGFSWITSRSKHPKQSQKSQDDFKKNFPSQRSSRSQVT